MDRDSSYRAWLLGPQEKLTEGIVGEYLGQSERSVPYTGGTAAGGRKLQYVYQTSPSTQPLVMKIMAEDTTE